MSAVAMKDVEYRPTPQPEPLFELEPGEEIILIEQDASLNADGYFKELRKLKDRYFLIGMTRRQYDYLRAVNSFQTTPGLPWVSTEKIAEELDRSYFTVYTIRKELVAAGLLIMRQGYLPTDGRLVWLHDFTPCYQKIKSLDDPEAYKKAKLLNLKRHLERSERARRAARMRWQNDQAPQQTSIDDSVFHSATTHPRLPVGQPSGEEDDTAFEAVHQNDVQNMHNTMQNQRGNPAISLSSSLSDSQGNLSKDIEDHLKGTDTSNLSNSSEKEEFFGAGSHTDHSQATEQSNERYNQFNTDETDNRKDRNREPLRLEEVPPEADNQTCYKNLLAAYGKSANPLPSSFQRYVEDFSLTFHDEAPKSTRTQIANVYAPLAHSGISDEDFMYVLYEARSRTQAATVKKRTADGMHVNRMAYFVEALAHISLCVLDAWAREEQQYGDQHRE